MTNILLKIDGYSSSQNDSDYCLIGCLRRRCEERGLALTLDHAKQQFLGMTRNKETGKPEEVLGDALLLRIRSAGSEAGEKDAA